MQQKILIVVGITVLLGASLYYIAGRESGLVTDDAVPPQELQQQSIYTNSELGLQFEYPVGPQGFVLEEREPSPQEAELVRSITLMPTADYERMATNPPVGGEGPAVIAIHVLRNDERQFSLGAAQTHTAYSSYNLKIGLETETVVGGANGIAYLADGLYSSDTIVVAHGGFAYVFTGQFMDASSALREQFQSLINSVSFIPTPTNVVGGKLDIKAVCEGALVYMTFPDGAAADAFVAECIEGKHPEVIERFKEQMGLGDGATI